MLLYILFYLVRFLQNKLNIETLPILVIVLLTFIITYIIWYDKSYYHIDDVLEKWVRFMFFESMLIGAFLREHYEKIRPGVKPRDIVCCIAFLIGHLVSKLVLRKFPLAAPLQIFSPIIVVSCITCIALIFIKLDKEGVWKRYNNRFGTLVKTVSGMSLEVYLGQLLILARINMLAFPVNLIVVTGMIFLYAWSIHFVADFIYKRCITLMKL